MKTFKRDAKKLRELVVYIAQQSDLDEYFGATKLNKVLFAADFLAYRDLGRPITGERYQALAWGPAPRGLLPALQELKEQNAIVEYERRLSLGAKQRRFVALRDPDLSLFSAEEIALVDGVLKFFEKVGAKAASEWSHEFIGYKATPLTEDIPYETIFVEDPSLPFSPHELVYARQLARGRSKETASNRGKPAVRKRLAAAVRKCEA